jgi:hypothetical protein
MSALTDLRDELMGEDPMILAGIRHTVTARLREIGVSAGEARELVAAALKPCRQPKRESGTQLQGRALAFEEIEPWDGPVDGAQLLNALVTTLKTFIVLPDDELCALALWALHTWVMAAADVAPRLVLTSPEPRCGKSRVLGVLSGLVFHPLAVSSLSGAALFRSIEIHAPTLLADEMDNARLNNPDRADLLAVLNGGWSRDTAQVLRCVGKEQEPRAFNAWASAALALIGDLPGPLEDRAIVIRMKRKKPGDKVERLRLGRIRADLEHIRRLAARWAADSRELLAELDPLLPPALDDRAADNWRPLLAIADLSGDTWPERAREVALALSANRGRGDSSAGTMLLTDIRQIFEAKDVDRRSTEQLLADLVDLESRPWGEWNRGKVITPRQLAKLLKPYDIVPGTIRLSDSTTPKGYLRSAFEEAFALYLPPADPPQRHND